MTERTVALLILTMVALAAPPARGEESRTQRAQQHVNAGQEAFNERDYETAISEWEAARALFEEPTITYNIALAHERLGNLPEAIEQYNRFLREDPEARAAEEVREHIEELHRQRVEERDADLEVEAADSAERDAVRDERAQRRSPLVEARHELDLVIGTAVAMSGYREAGNASLSAQFDYFFRFTSQWHFGASFLYDQYGRSVGDNRRQRQYGGGVNGRFAYQFYDGRMEIRALVGLGYQYIIFGRSDAIGARGHWVFLRAVATFAWDLIRGFGIHATTGFRLGVLPGDVAYSSRFGSSFDLAGGIFWAF